MIPKAAPILVLLLVGCSQPPTESIVLAGGTILPSPDGLPIVDGMVVAREGRIVAVGRRDSIEIPRGATVLECSGAYVVAGFQNSHVHLTEEKWEGAADLPGDLLSRQFEEMLLRYGFTTVVDAASFLSNTLELRERVDSGEVVGPRILTAGGGFYPVDGIPFYLRESMPPETISRLSTPAGPDEASALAAVQLESGADAVKLFTGSWVERGRVLPMDVDIARAAAEEGRRRGKPVLAHASNIAGLEVALEAGVDVLLHALDDDRGFDETHIARMKSANMAMVPTLKLFGGQSYTQYIQLLVRDFAEAGGTILFGTDVGFLEDYDPAEEYELMAGAGLDWRAILRSLTVAPAEHFGEASRRGAVAVGQDADLVVLAGDPRRDVSGFHDVRYVVRGARLVYGSGR